MTDLERVRKHLSKRVGDYYTVPTHLLADLDAHLTADAEADRMYDEQKAELARLREELAEVRSGWQKQTADWNIETARLRENLERERTECAGYQNELARLREDQTRLLRDTMHTRDRELARLREALRIIAKNGSYSDALLAAEALRGESDG